MIFSSEKYYCVVVQSFKSGMAAPLHKYITTICLISNFPRQIDWICSLLGVSLRVLVLMLYHAICSFN
jgi:hypothetical protein